MKYIRKEYKQNTKIMHEKYPPHCVSTSQNILYIILFNCFSLRAKKLLNNNTEKNIYASEI